MPVKIEVRGDDVGEIIASLGGYTPLAIERRDELLRIKSNQCDKMTEVYNELCDKYDAQAKVRDDTAAQLAAAMTESEKFYELNKTLSFDLGVATDHIAHLKKEVASLKDVAAEHDDSTDSKNKTRFNVDDMERQRQKSYKSGFSEGYDKGKAEQMAEHAAELVNRKPHVAEMLSYTYVDLSLNEDGVVHGGRAPFRFAPYMYATMQAVRNAHPKEDAFIGIHAPDKLVIVGINTLTNRMIAVDPDRIASWSYATREPKQVAAKPAKG